MRGRSGSYAEVWRRSPLLGVHREREFLRRASPQLPLVQAYIQPVPIHFVEELIDVVLPDESQRPFPVGWRLHEVEVQTPWVLASHQPNPTAPVVLPKVPFALLHVCLHGHVGGDVVAIARPSVLASVVAGHSEVVPVVPGAEEAPEHKVAHEAPRISSPSCDGLFIPLVEVIELVSVQVDPDVGTVPVGRNLLFLLGLSLRGATLRGPQRVLRWSECRGSEARDNDEQSAERQKGFRKEGDEQRRSKSAVASHSSKPPGAKTALGLQKSTNLCSARAA
mmetsp:Transcript_76464/g.212383  ORF Transcript_76464/g.212383 Transcript_76464/m.212383 type:complete len:279 (+) Transcript_76464:89-925(+)